jgi:hypothetical protein
MTVDVFIKFGDRQHMERLVQQGELYLNTLAHYRAGELGAERLDPNEGLERVLQMKGARLMKASPDSGASDEVALFTGGIARVMNSNLDKINVYCMFHYVLPDDDSVYLRDVVDERVWRGFGDTAVIIADAAAFVTRVKAAAKQRGLEHWRRKVSYVNLKLRNVEIGPFLKDEAYAHQSELRIAVFNPRSESAPLALTIGDISDLSWIIPASEIPSVSVTARTTESGDSRSIVMESRDVPADA